MISGAKRNENEEDVVNKEIYGDENKEVGLQLYSDRQERINGQHLNLKFKRISSIDMSKDKRENKEYEHLNGDGDVVDDTRILDLDFETHDDGKSTDYFL